MAINIQNLFDAIEARNATQDSAGNPSTLDSDILDALVAAEAAHYNVYIEVDSTSDLPALTPSNFGSLAYVTNQDDLYIAGAASWVQQTFLQDSALAQFIFQGDTAAHFVTPLLEYDYYPFATDVATAGDIPGNISDAGRTSNAGLSDRQRSTGYIVKGPPTATLIGQVNMTTNTTLAFPFTITTPNVSPNSSSNATDNLGGVGYLARTTPSVPTTTVKMDSITFASATPGGSTVVEGDLTTPVPTGWASASCPDDYNGYIIGGFAPGGPTTFDEIYKFPFASVTTLADTYNLPTGKGRGAGSSSRTAGYSFSGRGPGPAGAAENDSYKFPFATGVVSAITTPGLSRLGAASATSSDAAYLYKGNSSEFPTVTLQNSGQKVSYASDTITLANFPVASPSVPSEYAQGVQL